MGVELAADLEGHRDRIWQVSAHPNFPLLASSSADKTTIIWRYDSAAPSDEDSGGGLWTMDHRIEGVHERSIRTAAWKPGQTVLSLGSFDATLSLWEQEDNKWELLAQLEGHENEIKRVAWNCNGQFLASCSRDKSIWIWEVDEANEDFECVAVLQDHSQDVKHVVWHPQEEDRLASASYDDTVRLWRRDDDEWLCVADLSHPATVWGADFDANPAGGIRLVTSCDDGIVRIWRRTSESGGVQPGSLPSVARWDSLAEDWEMECELPNIHQGPVYAVSWSKTGISSVGADGRLAVYRVVEGGWQVEVVEEAHGVAEINSVTWFRGFVVTGGDDGLAKVWTV